MTDKEIKKSALSFPVYFEKVSDYTTDDNRFTKVKIYLMHTGLNYNESVFEKDVIDSAIPTLQYIPIVGFIQQDAFGEKDFKGHEYILVKDENGVQRKYIGSAYGVILSGDDNNAHYEMRTGDDGIEREYLCTEGILWNMFTDSSEIMNRDLVKKHSMELHEPSIEGYEDEQNIFHFTKFSFRAACILGNADSIQPAMINSTIEVQFTMSDFMKNLQSELEIKYADYTALEKEKGGNDMPTENKTPAPDFSQTVLQQFEDIDNIVRNFELTTNRWGEAVPRYYAVDIQDNEVIVVDKKNNYNYYGFSFTMSGDKPEINFTNAQRKKLSYTNYEEGYTMPQGSFDFGEHIAEIENIAFEKVSEAESKIATAEEEKKTAESNYTKLKIDYDAIKPKYDEYVKTEKEQQEKAIEAEKDAMFAKFEEELGNETDFTTLKEKKNDLSVKEIEQECALLFTRKRMSQDIHVTTDFSQAGSTTVHVMDVHDEVEDGYVSTKYGNIPIRK